MINTKICSKCGVEKPETEEFFYFRNDQQKFNNQCKKCKKEYCKKYSAANQEIIKEKQKKYYAENQEEIKEKVKKYRISNPDKIRERNKKYQANNKEKIKERKRKYEKNKRQTDPAFALGKDISRMISYALKNQNASKNGGSKWDYLPYTEEQLIAHIESLFDPWMNWENRGNYNSKTWNDQDSSTWTWQVDHIIPQSDLKFDSMKHPNFLKCWALSNLRPLNAKQNFIDGATRARHKKNK